MLENAWRKFAGSNSALAFNNSHSAFNRELEKELQSLLALFSGSRLNEKLIEYFQPRDLNSMLTSDSWTKSRRCLVTALNQLLNERVDFSQTKILVSLSHCPTACVAITSASSQVQNIGVDIERMDRQLSPAAEARILFSSEKNLGLSALESWVLKEASFKSDNENHQTIISDYQITQWVRNESHATGEVVSSKNPSRPIQIRLEYFDHHVIGFAKR